MINMQQQSDCVNNYASTHSNMLGIDAAITGSLCTVWFQPVEPTVDTVLQAYYYDVHWHPRAQNQRGGQPKAAPERFILQHDTITFRQSQTELIEAEAEFNG